MAANAWVGAGVTVFIVVTLFVMYHSFDRPEVIFFDGDAVDLRGSDAPAFNWSTAGRWLPDDDPLSAITVPGPPERYAAWRRAALWRKADSAAEVRVVRAREMNETVGMALIASKLNAFPRMTLAQAAAAYPEYVTPLALFKNVPGPIRDFNYSSFGVQNALLLSHGVTLLASDNGTFLRTLATRLNQPGYKIRLVGPDAPFIVLTDTVSEIMAPSAPSHVLSHQVSNKLAALPRGVCIAPVLGPFWAGSFQHFLQDHLGRMGVAIDAFWRAAEGNALGGDCQLERSRFLFEGGTADNTQAILSGGQWEAGAGRVSPMRLVKSAEQIAHISTLDGGQVIIPVRSQFRAAQTSGMSMVTMPIVRAGFHLDDETGKKDGRLCLLHVRKGHGARNMANDRQVELLLRKWCSSHGLTFQRLDDKFLANTDVAYHSFSHARFIAMLHGGAIYNTLPAPRDATVMELTVVGGHASAFVKALGHEYVPVAMGNQTRNDRDITCDIDAIAAALAKLDI